MTTVLAVDPGRSKCGIAVVSGNMVLHKGIVRREEIVSIIDSELRRNHVDIVIVGNGTGATSLVNELKKAGTSVPIELADEAFSTLEARKRFFSEHPPRGLRRLLPIGMLLPDRPYDDYVAVILAERYLSG